MAYTQEDWVEYLPSVELTINNQNIALMNISPFFMMHGYNVDPIQIDEELVERNEGTRLSPITRGEQVVKKLINARNWAEAAITVVQ